MHQAWEGAGRYSTGDVGNAMRAAVHILKVLLDTLTTLVFYSFYFFVLGCVEGAHLKMMALYWEIVTAYTLAYPSLNAEITEMRRLDHKAKKWKQTSFHVGFRHTPVAQGTTNTGAGALYPGVVPGTRGSPVGAVPGEKWGERWNLQRQLGSDSWREEVG